MSGAGPAAHAWHAAHAWLPAGLAADVLFEVADGRFTAVSPGRPWSADLAASGAVRLPGVVLPGLANAHSHAFHRALRGRTFSGGGSFWTWRRGMYELASRLDPDRYLALARGTYAEMARSGVTAVGEFHYLHHAAGGRRYTDPNAMGRALAHAAADAGIRLTLLDTCYLTGGLDPAGHRPLDAVQERFSDGSVEGWAARAFGWTPPDHVLLGAAIHSVRAVPRAALAPVALWAEGRPLHVHVSEQPAENDACSAFYGMTPTALLEEAGVLGPRATAVHATHLTDADVKTLGRTGTAVCCCPTTERDLGDGIGPMRHLADAGVPLCLGSDQHVVIDLLEEGRALEMDERLASGQRGRFSPAAVVGYLTDVGHRQLGWPDAGRLQVGALADLVAVRLDSLRTAGSVAGDALLAATAADVDTVVVAGRPVVAGGEHVLGDVGRLLADAIEPLWRS